MILVMGPSHADPVNLKNGKNGPNMRNHTPSMTKFTMQSIYLHLLIRLILYYIASVRITSC